MRPNFPPRILLVTAAPLVVAIVGASVAFNSSASAYVPTQPRQILRYALVKTLSYRSFAVRYSGGDAFGSVGVHQSPPRNPKLFVRLTATGRVYGRQPNLAFRYSVAYNNGSQPRQHFVGLADITGPQRPGSGDWGDWFGAIVRHDRQFTCTNQWAGMSASGLLTVDASGVSYDVDPLLLFTHMQRHGRVMSFSKGWLHGRPVWRLAITDRYDPFWVSSALGLRGTFYIDRKTRQLDQVHLVSRERDFSAPIPNHKNTGLWWFKSVETWTLGGFRTAGTVPTTARRDCPPPTTPPTFGGAVVRP